MLNKLRTLRAQPPAVRRRLPRALAVLATVSALLRLAGFARSHRWLAATSDRRAAGPVPADARERGGIEAVALHLAARNLPLRALCLERSLALWWLLRRQRVPAALRIGVRRNPGGEPLEAHAWVEVGDGVVGDAADVGARYAAFDGEVGALAAAIRPRRGGWRLGGWPFFD